MRKFISILLFILIFFLSFASISHAEIESYIWSQALTDVSLDLSANTNDASSNKSNLNLNCGSCILIEQNSGKVLYEQNCHEQLRPASVTKVMSLLLIMEAVDSGKIALTDKIPCSENAASMGGSQIWLDVREELTVDEMLKAICVSSANDCTVAMAEYIAGSTDAFVEKMNARAKELGMNDTCFKNCHGLDTDGHVTSSYDIALMSRELLLNHPNITKYTTIWMDTLRDGKSQLTNTNKLIRNYKGATGLKTGSTSLALYNLSASATRDSLSLIAVIMKAPTAPIRFSEAQKLLDYGFSNFSYEEFAVKGSKLKSINVNKGVSSTLNCIYESNAGTILEKGSSKNIEEIVNVPSSVFAPINKGDKIGEITYVLDSKEISKVNIIADEDIKKISLNNMFDKLFFDWFRVLR